ncbi:nuclear transport factor 2 family protein [Nocardia higoensis]|uniref:Nuclear transport factor 2 family protein n=1 Tax=Nocardia higoensis TaxID=228599 RepID=A0ABS0D3N1_9NOCA|nr:nuclear transport factor 2 family protein [Nocardia higoensis]MBF6353076.1 nuclear transport factor 2 family protein [Nocardia higoensis]
MPSVEQITSTVTEYAHRVSTGTAAEIAALYAEDATLEDPVGTEVRVGRDAIAAFYSGLDGVDTTMELLTLRVSGDTAAFHFRVTSTLPSGPITVEPIDVMTFDEQGRITSMRAIWNRTDMVTG